LDDYVVRDNQTANDPGFALSIKQAVDSLTIDELDEDFEDSSADSPANHGGGGGGNNNNTSSRECSNAYNSALKSNSCKIKGITRQAQSQSKQPLGSPNPQRRRRGSGLSHSSSNASASSAATSSSITSSAGSASHDSKVKSPKPFKRFLKNAKSTKKFGLFRGKNGPPF